MKDERFLVSTKDVLYSKKNTENKSFIRDGLPIDASVKIPESNSDAVEEILPPRSANCTSWWSAVGTVGYMDDVTLSCDARQILTTSLATLL